MHVRTAPICSGHGKNAKRAVLTRDYEIAVNGISLDVPAGSFYGLVGPNGAGKTTAMSMATGLLRPDHGRVWIHGTDVWEEPLAAKRRMGVLADGVRLFDRLTGEQLVTYSGLLRGLDRGTWGSEGWRQRVVAAPLAPGASRVRPLRGDIRCVRWPQ